MTRAIPPSCVLRLTAFLVTALLPVPAQASQPREVGVELGGSARSPKWSRDGAWLAHERREGSGDRVRTVLQRWRRGRAGPPATVGPGAGQTNASALDGFFARAGLSTSAFPRCRDLAWGPLEAPETHAHVCLERGPRIFWSRGVAVTAPDTLVGQPTWSPRGWTLLYLEVERRRSRAVVVRDLLSAKRPRPRRLTPDRRGSQMMLAVHPSGREVAWLERGPEGDDLWLVPLSSEPAQPRRLTKDRSLEFNPSWSPDGRLLAYFDSHAALKTGRDGSIRTPRRARVSLEVLEPRTGEVFVVAENVVPSYGLGPAWTPDGGGLVWVGRNAKRFDPLMYAEISEGRAGPAQRLPTPKTLSHRDVAVRPAGPRWTIAYTGLPAQPGADRSRRRLYVLEMGNDAPGWAR